MSRVLNKWLKTTILAYLSWLINAHVPQFPHFNTVKEAVWFTSFLRGNSGAVVVCLSDHHCSTLPSCCAVCSPLNSSDLTMMPCVGAHSLFWVQPIPRVSVEAHRMPSENTEHRKVSASVVLTDQMSSLLFNTVLLPAPALWHSIIHEEMVD